MYQSSFSIVPERDGATREDLLKAFVEWLEKLSARHITVHGNTVFFKGGVWRFRRGRFTWNTMWDVLFTITSGRIEVGLERVTYSLTFTQWIILCTAFVGLTAALMVSQLGVFPELFFVVPIAWLTLVVLDNLFALALLRRCMKRCIRDAGFAIVKRQKVAG